MGCSAAAFTTSLDAEGWDPLAAAPSDPPTPDRPALGAGDGADRALASWAEAVRDEARWAGAKHAGSAAFADHAMRALLVDKRRAAGRFLRSIRGLFPNAPGADLLRAAESYGYAAETAAKGGLGEFAGGTAMRFLDVGHRRGSAKNL